MKVYASRTSNVRSKIDAYKGEVDAYLDRKRVGESAYRDAQDNYRDKVARDIRSHVKAIAPDLAITVDFRHNRIVVNGGRDRNNILNWSITAEQFANRQVGLSTSSYSGLNAIDYSTDQLRQIADALDYLMDKFDWNSAFNDAPKYSDFETVTEDDRPEKHDYSLELQDAVFEDMMGEPVILKIPNWADSKVRGNEAYIQVTGETPKFWKVFMASSWAVDNYLKEDDLGREFDLEYIFDRNSVPARLRKDTLYIDVNNTDHISLR